MFGLFRKKTEVELLTERYKKLLEESFRLSHSNRKASDQKVAEAEELMAQIDKLRK